LKNVELQEFRKLLGGFRSFSATCRGARTAIIASGFPEIMPWARVGGGNSLLRFLPVFDVQSLARLRRKCALSGGYHRLLIYIKAFPAIVAGSRQFPRHREELLALEGSVNTPRRRSRYRVRRKHAVLDGCRRSRDWKPSRRP
jgi:hypothetical protein